jgi:uncharacterized membrane protein YhaH (DUF805 family)
MPSLMQRHVKWNARISRKDFVAYPIVCFCACLALGLWQQSPPEGPLLDFAILLIWPLIAFLMLAASKRCRDAGYSPWIGILAVLIPFGVLILLFTPGTYGSNRFGPSPRAKKPNQALQPTAATGRG